MQLKELSYLSDNSFMRCFDKAGAFNKVSRHSKLSQVFQRCSSSNKSSFNVSKKKKNYMKQGVTDLSKMKLRF